MRDSLRLLRWHRRRELEVVPVWILECGEPETLGVATRLVGLVLNGNAEPLDALEFGLYVGSLEIQDDSPRSLIATLHVRVRTDHQHPVPRLPAHVAAVVPRGLTEDGGVERTQSLRILGTDHDRAEVQHRFSFRRARCAACPTFHD